MAHMKSKSPARCSGGLTVTATTNLGLLSGFPDQLLWLLKQHLKVCTVGQLEAMTEKDLMDVGINPQKSKNLFLNSYGYILTFANE